MSTKKYSIKDIEWLLPHNLNQKLVIFLDTFVWSNIITECNEHYKTLGQILKRLVKDKKVHVAVYMGSVLEIAMRDDKGQVRKIIDLIEELSSGVFIKCLDLTFDDELTEEVTAKLKGRKVQPIDRNRVFGPFWEFAQSLSIEMPEWFEDVEPAKKDDLLNQLRKKIYSVQLADSDFPKHFGQAGSQFKSNIEQSLKKRYEQTMPEMSLKEILTEEQKAFGKTFSLNFLKVMLKIAKDNPLKGVMSNLTAKELTDCVYRCPTFYCYTNLQARLRYQKDKGKHLKANHAYDALHLGIAIPYVDWLFCDKEMAEVTRQAKLDKKYKTKIYTEPDIPQMICDLKKLSC